jgi:hypothetical protein
MKKMEYEITPVDEKPKRRFIKRSKYDPILDSFLEGDSDVAEVEVEGKDPYYLRNQLNKRIELRDLKDLKVSTVKDVVYLEKI